MGRRVYSRIYAEAWMYVPFEWKTLFESIPPLSFQNQDAE